MVFVAFFAFLSDVRFQFRIDRGGSSRSGPAEFADKCRAVFRIDAHAGSLAG